LQSSKFKEYLGQTVVVLPLLGYPYLSEVSKYLANRHKARDLAVMFHFCHRQARCDAEESDFEARQNTLQLKIPTYDFPEFFLTFRGWELQKKGWMAF